MNLKLLITTTALASLILSSNAQYKFSDQESFDARVEQKYSDLSNGSFRAEKSGNVVRLISAEHYTWEPHYAQVTAKFYALDVLVMDSIAKMQNPAHKLAPFIKLLVCEPDGTIAAQGVVFREDYANLRGMMDALDATKQELHRIQDSLVKRLKQRLQAP
jgi:hypothetical protein